MILHRRFHALVVVLTLLFCACASQQFLVRPSPEITRLNRIAVFPFENLSGEPDAGGRVTSIMASELYNSGLVNLVEPGEVQQFILRSRIRVAGQLDLDTIREASRQLTADGIIFGSVNEYTVITSDLGPLPAVSMTVRLVDANTGEIVWAATHSLQGDFKETVFGIGRVNSLGSLSEIVVKDLILALGTAMYPEEEEIAVAKYPRRVSTELKPRIPIEEPVIPLPASREELEAIEAEKQKAHSAVMQEWEIIKGTSQ